MYRHCIYCSADLGSNEAVETFPIGRSVAFDAAKGRLWAICPKCARWNLAPIEERWEVVETAERLFVDSRLRVQSENVGMAKLRDGTRLIRVGEALPGELAAWRYGRRFIRRRREYVLRAFGARVLGGLLVAGVGGALLGGAVAYSGLGVGLAVGTWFRLRDRKVIFRLPAERSPTGSELLLRRQHARTAVLRPGESGADIALALPDAGGTGRWIGRDTGEGVVLGDADARTFLQRAMVDLNHVGGSRRRVEGAVELLADAGNAAFFLHRAAVEELHLTWWKSPPGRYLAGEGSLALEMALHEESERRAMQGELKLLESAWRQAEEIAAIADGLAVSSFGTTKRDG